MDTLITLAPLIILIAVIGLLVKLASKKGTGASYYKKKPLTQAEKALYYKLLKALPNNPVLAQVSMSAIVGIKKGKDWQSTFNKISRKYADFVICSPAFDVIAIIELDDSSHESDRARHADKEKDAALNGAGYTVIRWRQKDIPSVEDIPAALGIQH
ncbi:conserved protein of unknown function [Sterolibacterium denitrificans]|uniref:DUF2726 domain-containing protein n=1 Tax=Sterolibacterium denitrificans TaxID=157592 RepID=A0A7Z7MVL1_9PROT|nr:DUF2726 domain-containing protein [Sterolibacterium denitrificans]SMB28121.1 conserved protein of unknown function [Sterolibacterium denitrificans]